MRNNIERGRRLGVLGASAVLVGAMNVAYDAATSRHEETVRGAVCSPIYTDTHIFPGDNQVFEHVKRAVYTGDANFPDQGIFRDSDALTAEMVIIDFPEYTDLPNVDQGPHEGNLRKFTSCATNKQFNRIIGKMEREQLSGKPTEFSVNTFHIPQG